jgi:4a-hydroxytetrahydrobiopterin dehydratase
MADLSLRRCQPCDASTPPLTDEEILALLPEVADWMLVEEGRALTRTFAFADYWETMAFVNAVAWIAHQQDHHPDLSVHYNRVVVRWSTHVVGGLSENDFICAAKVASLGA